MDDLQADADVMDALLGEFGDEVRDDVLDRLEDNLEGLNGPMQQGEARRFVDAYLAVLDNNEMEDTEVAEMVGDQTPDADEVAAAEERIRNVEATEYLEAQFDALEEVIGRGLTPAEEDTLITDDLLATALEGGEVDLVADRAKELKAKTSDPAGRKEIGAAAIQRLREKDPGPYDGLTDARIAGMSTRENRVERGAVAAQLARDGVSMDDIDQMIADDAQAPAEDGEEE